MASAMNFTVVRLSGRPEFYNTATYFDVLDKVAVEYGSAGSNWDRPNMLLLNGKVVVKSGLSETAWKWRERSRELQRDLRATLTSEFKPEWLDATEDQSHA